MKRWLCALLALCLLPLCAAAELEDSLPDALQVSQTKESLRLDGTLYGQIHYPHTVNADVDAALRAVLDALADRAVDHFPLKPADKNEGAVLDCGPSVFRTGDRWVSFLSLAMVRDGREQIYVDFDARAYDVVTGRRLTLDDVVADAAGLALVSAAARERLAAYFPEEAADPALLDALTAPEALANVPFTLNAAFLQLHYRADALYPGKNTLMHVRVPYADLRAHMTDAARMQTDNSRRKLLALTYDDGPVRGRTLRLIRNLRAGGAGATFFIVGERIRIGHDEISFAHDAGFTIASHNYKHVYHYANQGKVAAFRDQLNAELGAVVGDTVRMMRAPGGNESIFIREDVHLPLIHWSVISSSKNGKVENPASEAHTLASVARDGDIILLHDMYSGTDVMAETLPRLLAERGFLCVTLEELFAARGIPLEPNQVYWNAREAE